MQCDDLKDDNAFATMVIDRKYIPLGYVTYARGVEAIIKASYIFNLEYEKSIQNILNYIARFVMQVKDAQIKSSLHKLFEHIN